MAITYHAGRRIQGLSYTAGSEVGETSGSDETKTLGVNSSRYRGGIKIATGSALIGQTLSPTKGIKFELKRTGLSGSSSDSRFEIWNGTTIISSATTTFQPDTKVGTSYAYVELFPASTVTLAEGDRITIATDGGVTNYYTFRSNSSGSYDTTKTHWTESTYSSGSGGTWTDETGIDGNFKFTLADVGDSKPTNVQVGSRYEETDTRNMYYRMDSDYVTDKWFELGTAPYAGGRGVFVSGYSNSNINVIDYITIATTGDATDYGDLLTSRRMGGAVANTSRAVFAGGYSSSYTDVMDYITILTGGTATAFGTTMPDTKTGGMIGVGNGTRGLFAGGEN